MWRDFTKDDLIKDIRLILCIQAMHARVLGVSDDAIEKWIGPAASDRLPNVDDLSWFELIQSNQELLGAVPVDDSHFGQYTTECFDRVMGETELSFCDIDAKWADIFLRSLPKLADENAPPKCLSEDGTVRILLEHVKAAGRVWHYLVGGNGWISVKSLACLARTSEQTVRNALSQKKTELPTFTYEGGVAIRISAAIPWLAARRGFRPARDSFSFDLAYSLLCKKASKFDKPHPWLRSVAFWNCGLPPVIAQRSGLSIQVVERILQGDTTIGPDALAAFADVTLINREALQKAFAAGFEAKECPGDVR